MNSALGSIASSLSQANPYVVSVPLADVVALLLTCSHEPFEVQVLKHAQSVIGRHTKHSPEEDAHQCRGLWSAHLSRTVAKARKVFTMLNAGVHGLVHP